MLLGFIVLALLVKVFSSAFEYMQQTYKADDHFRTKYIGMIKVSGMIRVKKLHVVISCFINMSIPYFLLFMNLLFSQVYLRVSHRKLG